jgi:hypothetical protein
MSGRVRSWIALGVVVFVGHALCRPAVAAAAPNDEPTVTPYGKGSEAPAAAAPAPAPAAPAEPRVAGHAVIPAPPAGNGAPPAPPYPPPPYGRYPPPGYAPYPYPPPYPGYPPPQPTKVHRPRRGLVAAGAITFGVSWSIAASISLLLAGCTDCNNGVNYLWVPIAGPLMLAGNGNSDGTPVLLLWSAAQAAGVAMFAIGMAGHDVMEYRYADRGPTFQLGPLIARDASGMTLTARW